jgi:hypothetical protein
VRDPREIEIVPVGGAREEMKSNNAETGTNGTAQGT